MRKWGLSLGYRALSDLFYLFWSNLLWSSNHLSDIISIHLSFLQQFVTFYWMNKGRRVWQRLPFCYWRFIWIAIFYIHFALSLKLRLKTVKFKKGKTAITYLFSSNQCLAPIDTDEEHWQSQYHLPHSLSQFWKEVCTTVIMVKCTFYISNLKQGNLETRRRLNTTSFQRL